jgi:hypothetical protein
LKCYSRYYGVLEGPAQNKTAQKTDKIAKRPDKNKIGSLFAYAKPIKSTKRYFGVVSYV